MSNSFTPYEDIYNSFGICVLETDQLDSCRIVSYREVQAELNEGKGNALILKLHIKERYKNGKWFEKQYEKQAWVNKHQIVSKGESYQVPRAVIRGNPVLRDNIPTEETKHYLLMVMQNGHAINRQYLNLLDWKDHQYT